MCAQHVQQLSGESPILPERYTVNMAVTWEEGCCSYLGRSHGHGKTEYEPKTFGS